MKIAQIILGVVILVVAALPTHTNFEYLLHISTAFLSGVNITRGLTHD